IPLATPHGLHCIDASVRYHILPVSFCPLERLGNDRCSVGQQRRDGSLKGILLRIGASKDLTIWSNEEGKCKQTGVRSIGSNVRDLEIVARRGSWQCEGTWLILSKGTLRIKR